MKKLLLIAVLLTGLFASAQNQTDYYTATATALYQKYSSQPKWTMVKERFGLSIPISLTGGVLSINAELASVYRIYGTYTTFSGYSSSGEKYEGKTWKAVDVVGNKKCSIDILRFENSDARVICINFWDESPQVSLRYFID